MYVKQLQQEKEGGGGGARQPYFSADDWNNLTMLLCDAQSLAYFKKGFFLKNK